LEFESTNNQLEENKSQFIVTAPVTGILMNAKSLEIGSFLSSGQPFVDISPNTNLLVECYISPQDIGLLKLNNQANFQIDAFNYNQWGLASGSIIEIGKDIEFIDNTSAFKIQCSINEKALKLKNGFEGKLKKGMTLNAQFKQAERTLFDLLYDKVDDWVNPSQKDIASSK
jgi:HlyD family secretion protein